MDITIYHNPRCSKSRQALEHLRKRDVEPEIVYYLKTPLTANQLRALLQKLEISAHDLVRKKEALYKELNLAGANEDTLIEAMVTHPRLMERPIVVRDQKAVVGRPTESIDQLF